MDTLDHQDRTVAALLAFTAATLAVASILHLFTGDGVAGTFDPNGAGIAEAIICIVLLVAYAALLRAPRRGRTVALGATGFAIFGFLVGLTFTVRGGSPADLIYHLTMLPVLVATLVLLLRREARR
jgi:hypothetical protein